MKKHSLRYLFLSLTLVLLLAVLLPAPIRAQAAEVSLSKDGYYEITTADELYTFAAMVNAGDTAINGRLMNNIVVNEHVLDDDGTLNGSDFRVWTPIGADFEGKYAGTFEGNGFAISGLFFNDSTADYVGLFGCTDSGSKILNIEVVSSYLCGRKYVGGVVGYSIFGTISNCHNAGTVFGNDHVGGIAGKNEDASIVSCDNTGTVRGGNHAGGVAGSSLFGTITNSHNTGTVYGSDYAGGITGHNQEASVLQCYNAGDISGNDYIGGVVGWGWYDSDISNCHNTGAVTGRYDVGGVAGCSYDTVRHCYNTGAVSGNDRVGGVVGYAVIDSVKFCYNTGSVSGCSYIGGVVGDSYAESISNCRNSGTVFGSNGVGGIVGSVDETVVKNCCNTGAISGIDLVGGVVGYRWCNDTVTNCYFLSGTASSGIPGSSDALGCAEAKSAAQFASGEVAYLLNGGVTDGTQAWYQTIGTDAVPVFFGGTVYRTSGCNREGQYSNRDGVVTHDYDSAVTPPTCTDEGYMTHTCACGDSYRENTKSALGHTLDETGFCIRCDSVFQSAILKDDCYEIYNAGQLYWFAAQVNTGNKAINGKLMANIVVNKNVLKNGGTLNGSDFRVWTPIGNGTTYTGAFDGNGYTISGLFFNDSTASYVGLFSKVGQKGNVKNVGIIDSYFCGQDQVGAVAGYNSGTITNCYNTGTVSGGRRIGGVVGDSDGIVTNCHNTGNVSGDGLVGGVVGTLGWDEYILGYGKNCFNTGKVSGNSCVGGVFGYISDFLYVGKCYNTGTVVGKEAVGGITGGLGETDLEHSYNTGTVSCTVKMAGGIVGECIFGTVTYSYNTGAVSCNGSDVGSVVGHLSRYSSVEHCYYLTGTAKKGIGYKDGSVGWMGEKTSAQFASGEVAYLLNVGKTDGKQVWYQTVGTDAIPRYTGATVYQNTEPCATYSNTNAGISTKNHTGGNPCTEVPVCKVCGVEYGEILGHSWKSGACSRCGLTIITQQPVNASAYNGKTVKVTVGAQGEGLTYQWYYADPGSDTFTLATAFQGNTYSISMNAARNGCRVYCAITDQHGNVVNSDTVTLKLRTWMKITKQPVSVSAYNGKTAKVTVGVKGDGLTYQWYYANAGSDQFKLTGSFKGSTYSVSMTAARSGRRVYCVITDAYGRSVKTDVVTLSRRTWMKITKQPANVWVSHGKMAKVTVNVQGDGLRYKWYYAEEGSSKFTHTKAFSTKSYYVEMNAARDGCRVYCVITDKYGRSVKTNVVTLHMRTGLKITKLPVSVTVSAGQMARVTVGVQGDGLTYRWYYADAGATKFTRTTAFSTNSYYVEMNNARAGRRVYCVITDRYGNSVQTNTVTLKKK